jgi:hypothetical protein
MRDAISAFQSDVFTPAVTLVAPGSIALAPLWIGFLWRHQEVWPFLEKHNLEMWAILVFMTVILGLMLENFGSMIEAHIFDVQIAKNEKYKYHASHESDWYDYLRLAFKIEPIGHRYMRNLVLHLRFERNGCIAFAVAALGCLYLPISRSGHFECAIPLWMVAIYLYWEAEKSHEALSELRHELLKGFRVIGDVSTQVITSSPENAEKPPSSVAISSSISTNGNGAAN